MNRATPDQLLHKLKQLLGEELFDEVKVAFLKAEDAHKKQTRYNGDPYILHPLRVCIILIEELNLRDKNSIISALLHDAVEDSDISLEEIETLFGKKVAEYVKLLTKHKEYQSDIDRQKKYFWHLKRSPKKVQIIKLADRLDNMRELETCTDLMKKRKYILDTSYNYLDWAKETKPYIAGELEDLIFKYREQLGDYDI